MNAYLTSVIENVKKKHGNEPEFVQTVVKILLIGSLTFHFCLALCYMHLAVFQIG